MFFGFLLLLRSIRTKTLAKYPYFYGYIFCVSGVSLVLFIGRAFSPGFYFAWYWPTQFATLLAGCGVILEILRQSLAAYPGAQRFGQVASCVVFAVTLFYVEWHAASKSDWSPTAVTVELELDLRVIEVLVLATVLAIVFYYRIELAKNVTGMILGFGAYVGISLTTLALRSFAGPQFNAAWGLLQSASFVFATVVWTFALWTYSPNPVPIETVEGEAGYDALVQDTRERLTRIRSSLPGAVRR
jgi:hypothetical protein